VTAMPDSRGPSPISAVVGPTCTGMQGREQRPVRIDCEKPSCIWPRICPNLDTDQSGPLPPNLPGCCARSVSQASITPSDERNSRYDLLLERARSTEVRQDMTRYINELLAHHVSGPAQGRARTYLR